MAMHLMSKKEKAAALTWQRGYRCHTLWSGQTRLGRISLGPHGEWDGLYRCEAGTRHNVTTSLTQAKRWVREQVRQQRLQLSLF